MIPLVVTTYTHTHTHTHMTQHTLTTIRTTAYYIIGMLILMMVLQCAT